MATQETYLTSFVESMQITAERFVQIGQFDKTVNGKIVDHDSIDSTLYYVSVTGCSRLPVRKSIDDATIYLINDDVYISIPNGDFSSPDKLIIGKVNSYFYTSKFKKPEDYLLKPISLSSFPYTNEECYSTFIIEFIPKFNNVVEGALGIKEQVFSYTISFTDNKGINQNINGIWSTNNLYGAIFNTFVPNKQYIIISGLENYRNIKFAWNTAVDAISAEAVTYGGKVIGETVLNLMNNVKYYCGYGYDFLEAEAVYNTVIKLTSKGYFIFKKITSTVEELFYQNQNNADWELPDSVTEDINFIPYWVQLDLNFSTDGLNRLDKYKNYLWHIEWYEKDLSLLEEEKVSYVPNGWRKIEQPNVYKNKMVCLIATSKDTILNNLNTNNYLKILYSIYE